MRNVSLSKRCSNGLVFASFRAKKNVFLRHICQIPPSNCTTMKQVHLNQTTYCGIFSPTQKLHVVVFSVLLMVFLVLVLCFCWGVAALNAVILVAHISAAKYKVEVSAFRVYGLGLCFLVLRSHRTLTSCAKPRIIYHVLISLSGFAWIVRRRLRLFSVGFWVPVGTFEQHQFQVELQHVHVNRLPNSSAVQGGMFTNKNPEQTRYFCSSGSAKW